MGIKFKIYSEDVVNKFKIDSPEKAYTLGFLWGDGWLQKSDHRIYIAIEIVAEDFKQIKSCFDTFGKWTFHHRKRGSRKLQTIANLSDTLIGWYLRDNDYSIKSNSTPTKILEKVPEIYKKYWWRGYFDADGCYYFNEKTKAIQFSISSGYDQDWSEVIKLFNQIEIKKYSVQRRDYLTRESKLNRQSAIRVTGRDSLEKIYNYIYSDSCNIGLNRKYEKILKIKKYLDSRAILKK